MQISHALPFEFWPTGEETFNEKSVCGITPICWCQPWNCNDEISLQFLDDEEEDYSLNITDADENVIENKPFTRTQLYTEDYLASYPLSGFTNEETGNTDWTTGTNPSVSISGIAAASDNLIESITGVPAGKYILKVGFDTNSPLYTLTVRFFKGGIQVGTGSVSLVDPNGGTASIVVTLSDAPDTIKFRFGSVTGSKSITINSVSMNRAGFYYSLNFTPSSYCNQQVKLQIQDDGSSPGEVVAKTDCISMKEAHSCTVPIDYYNNSNFNNIIYDNISPQVTFRLRVPAIFFREDNPTEREDSELSNGEIVRLYNKLELRRRLDLGFMPQYMHQKIQFVLMHDNVEIDGKRWIQRGEYEKADTNRQYPLNRASVWLHDKDFIKENQL
jgi:hypothetical protein